MKCRTVSFFVESARIQDVMTNIDAEVLPRFLVLPHFLGLVALQSPLGTRAEVVVMSLWDDELEESETVSESFRGRIQQATGMTPERRAFDVLRVMVLNANGETCLDSPQGSQDCRPASVPRQHRAGQD